MHPAEDFLPRLTPIIGRMRWAIPITLSLFGFGYTVWESILGDGYSVMSAQALLGFGLLGILGPALTYITLTWAERAASSFEHAERARDQQYRQMVALNTISGAVNQSLDLNTVLNRAMDHILQVMGLESGEVRLLENNHLILRTSRNVSPDFIEREKDIPVGQCLCGKCAVRGELIAIENLDHAPELTQTACACEHFKAVLSVPVRTTEHVVGVIHVASRSPRRFNDSDRALLATIGQQVGTAIEKAQLHSQVKTLNQQLEARVAERTRDLFAAKEELAHKADALRQVLAEERRVEEKTRAHIAHDLHDGVQQIIIGAMYETQAARESMERDPHMATDRLDAAQELLRRIGSEMRDSIYSLRPLALDMQGLAPALREAVASFERVARIGCALHVEGTPQRFSPDAEIAAFRIVQEALNNVEAHAQAQQVRVQVCFAPREVQVEVADDGKGFDMNEVMQQARTHLGLIGMQERVESVGGNLQVWSRVGEGTRVCLTLPLVKRES